MIKLDKDSGFLEYSPVCTFCKNFNRDDHISAGKRSCTAFADIPVKIWNGEDDHQKPFAGDHGIRFEKV